MLKLTNRWHQRVGHPFFISLILLLLGCSSVQSTGPSGVIDKSSGRIWDRAGTISIVPANGWVQAAIGSDDFLRILLKGPPSSRGNPTLAVTAFTDAMVLNLKLETHRDADIANHLQSRIPGYKAEHLGKMTVGDYPGIAWTASWRALGSTIKSQDVATKVGITLYSITYQGVIEDYDLQKEALKQMILSVRFGQPK